MIIKLIIFTLPVLFSLCYQNTCHQKIFKSTNEFVKRNNLYKHYMSNAEISSAL